MKVPCIDCIILPRCKAIFDKNRSNYDKMHADISKLYDRCTLLKDYLIYKEIWEYDKLFSHRELMEILQ